MTRREWLLVMAVLMMTEYWIVTSSYEYKSSELLISYVSFAATIASILLAIIAIIYSFVQADAQQSASAMIVSQIDSLRSVSEKLSDSGGQITDQILRITDTATKLEQLEGSLDSANQKLQGIEGHITGLQVSQQQVFTALNALTQKSDSSLDKPTVNLNDGYTLAYRLYQSSSFDADLFGYFLSRYLKSRDSIKLSIIQVIVKLYVAPIDTSERTLTPNASGQGGLSKAFLLLSISRSLGIMTAKDKDWEVRPEFIEHIHKIALITKANTEVPLIAETIKLIDAAELDLKAGAA